MNLHTRIIKVDSLDPWRNLALEEYLLDRVGQDECILYLWQNQNTVVIGKNQNPWRECRTELLEKEQGKLARRLSGGGAVFHDLGNLNFTFVVGRELYNLEKQVRVILEAVKSLGIEAVMNGRNDLEVEGRKFSGNAFCFRKNSAYHHGTLMVSADMEKLTRYLQVSQEKIRAKGVQSVRARVINLSEKRPELSIEDMKQAVSRAFQKIYGGEARVEENPDWMDKTILQELYEKYASWEWRYGEAPQFDMELSFRHDWGGVEIGLMLQNAVVKQARVYSDAMDEEFIQLLPAALNGKPFKSPELAAAIRSIPLEGEERRRMADDIAAVIENKGF